jgi:hypothetical protein
MSVQSSPAGDPSGHGETRPSDRSAEPVSTLRATRVEVDVRRIGPAAFFICLIALGVVTITLFVAGAEKNAQLSNLRQHGIPVEITVSSCLGQLGGSGSNAAGYACHGTFTFEGHRYLVSVPGNVLRYPGTKVHGVTVARDPHLISTASEVARDAPSPRVFILPSVLLALLVLGVVAFAVRWRRSRNGAGFGSPD